MLITDGEASGNRLSMSDAALRACAADVAVSAVFMPAQTGFGGLSSGGGLLRKLVADTGGIFRANESLTAAGWRERDHLAPLGPIVDGLRTSYLLDLALEPEALEAGSVRRLDVSTRDPALMIHAPALVCR